LLGLKAPEDKRGREEVIGRAKKYLMTFRFDGARDSLKEAVKDAHRNQPLSKVRTAF